MWPTKRLFVWVIVATLTFLWIQSGSVYAESSEETYFIATAYYSPLPGQNRYTTGTYEWDIRLNGSGIITASGKEVFEGLLAGPKNYPFGTKIYFEWYGIGEIADRGGAIVKAWERGQSYDRIDIWMGHGDEWLERALKWGKRTIKGKIVVPSSELSLKLWASPLWDFTNLRVHPKSSPDEVKQLQEIFSKADLYSGKVDGEYQSIRNELIEFQMKNSVITGYADEEAWYFWPKSVSALRKKYAPDTPSLVEESADLFFLYNHRYASEKYKTILQYGDLVVNPESENDRVVELQKLMQELWEYNWNLDGKYHSIEKPLIDLQIKIGLIENNDDWWAWYFGNKTKTALWNYYETYNQENIVLSDNEKIKMENTYLQVRKKLKTQELQWGEKMQVRLQKLESQISEFLPVVTDPIMKSKLIYLQELLQN